MLNKPLFAEELDDLHIELEASIEAELTSLEVVTTDIHGTITVIDELHIDLRADS